MCTPGCKCFEGEGGSTKQKWVELGDQKLSSFGRNTGKKLLTIDGKSTSPMYWTSNEDDSIASFKECYE